MFLLIFVVLSKQAVHALEKDRQMLRHRLTSVEAEVTRLQSRLEDSETFKIELERQRDEASSKASQAEVRLFRSLLKPFAPN